MALVLKKASILTQVGIFKSLKKEVSVKLMIHKRLAGYEEPRKHGMIHASELLKDKGFCPREWAFLDMGLAKKKSEFIGTALRITFDHGRDMESRLRNEWLRDVMVGEWKCGVCSHVHPTFGKAPKIRCPKCGWGHQWTYNEMRFESPTTGVSGGVDGLLDVGDAKLRLLEIKSIAPDAFKTLAAPLAEHKSRTSLYLRLADESTLSESNRINTDEATILYVAKSFGFKDESMKAAGIPDAPFSPFKEFAIKRQDDLTENLLNRAKALTLWRNLPEGKSPGLPAGICPNGLCKRAQQCTAVIPCFSGAHMSTITWLENGKPVHPGKPLIA